VDFSQVGAFLSVAPTLEEKAASVGIVARSRDVAGHTEKVKTTGEQTPRRDGHRAASCARMERVMMVQQWSHMRTADLIGFFWRKTSSVERHRVGRVQSVILNPPSDFLDAVHNLARVHVADGR